MTGIIRDEKSQLDESTSRKATQRAILLSFWARENPPLGISQDHKSGRPGPGRQAPLPPPKRDLQSRDRGRGVYSLQTSADIFWASEEHHQKDMDILLGICPFLRSLHGGARTHLLTLRELHDDGGGVRDSPIQNSTTPTPPIPLVSICSYSHLETPHPSDISIRASQVKSRKKKQPQKGVVSEPR